MRSAILALLASLVPSIALANSGKLNLNADLGVGAPFTGRYGTESNRDYSAQAYGPHLSLGLDYQVFRPLAIELMGEVGLQVIPPYLSYRNREQLPGTVLTGGLGIGPRLRFFDDEKGNLWLSLHLGFRALEGVQFAVDAGAGYQFAVTRRFGLGPFLRGEVLAPSATSTRGSTFLMVLGVGASFELLPFEASAPGAVDDDGDGLTTESELEQHHTDPRKRDTDGDGLPDGLEVSTGTDPLKADTDRDGLADGAEDRNRNGEVDAAETDPRVAEKKPALEMDLTPPPPPPAVVAAPVAPPADTDGDGVADESDNCPKEKGPASNQGCPAVKKQLVVITKDKLEILDKVYFDVGKATILKKSFPLLDQVATVLNGHPELVRVQVEGHTDNQGNADRNLKLSQDRASAVVKYLTDKKVASSRLEPIGYGPKRPADSNDTAVGREKNRRVEFKIVGK